MREVEDEVTGREEVNDLIQCVQERSSLWELQSVRTPTGVVLQRVIII